mgnify:CR=1 FL=1
MLPLLALPLGSRLIGRDPKGAARWAHHELNKTRTRAVEIIWFKCRGNSLIEFPGDQNGKMFITKSAAPPLEPRPELPTVAHAKAGD